MLLYKQYSTNFVPSPVKKTRAGLFVFFFWGGGEPEQEKFTEDIYTYIPEYGDCRFFNLHLYCYIAIRYNVLPHKFDFFISHISPFRLFNSHSLQDFVYFTSVLYIISLLRVIQDIHSVVRSFFVSLKRVYFSGVRYSEQS